MEKNKRHEDYALRQVMGEQARQAEKMKLSDGFADRVMQRVMEKSGERELSHWSPLRKIAAAVAVILTISGIAYATYSAMSVAGDEEVAATAEVAEEKPAEEPVPRRRGRPSKKEKSEEETPTAEQTGVTRRRGRTKKSEEVKELFPFYEQSLF